MTNFPGVSPNIVYQRVRQDPVVLSKTMDLRVALELAGCCSSVKSM